MKKITLLILTLLIVVSSFAHLINPVSGNNACSKSGYTDVNGTYFDYTGLSLDYATFYITKTGNGIVSPSNPIVWDTTITLTSANLTFYLKSVSSTENVFIEEYTRDNVNKPYTLQYSNFNNNGDINSSPGYGIITSPCTSTTPVIFVDVAAQLNQGILTFKWTTTSESNNLHFVIEGSSDGVNWEQVGTTDSYWSDGNGSTSHAYTFNYNDTITTEAGVGSGIILVFILLSGLLFKKKKRSEVPALIGLVFLSLTIFSCHKTSVSTITATKYSYFRLSQVDKDGTVSYYQTVFKVN